MANVIIASVYVAGFLSLLIGFDALTTWALKRFKGFRRLWRRLFG